jgi:predicted aldo/keto reductase-like oxidoreductase
MGGIPLTRPTEAEAIRLVHRALDLGVSFFDTARGYGISEERFGKALAEVADRRGSIVIATKGGGDKAGAQRSIEESLRQLQIEAIDLWQFHGVNTFASLDSILGPGGGMEGARDALQAGKIRHIGFSSHSLKVALKGVASGHFETVQFPFNFISNEATDALIPLAQEYDLGFVAMKPFAGGRIQSANMAIKYLMQFDSVVPDPGIETIDEIEEIVAIVNSGSWELTAREQRELEEIRARVGTRFCRQCEYCMPCPEGVHICGALYLEILWDLWPPELYFARHSIGGYVRNAVASAEKCVQCGECEAKCPYQLPIRDMIAENVTFHERMVAEHNIEIR